MDDLLPHKQLSASVYISEALVSPLNDQSQQSTLCLDVVGDPLEILELLLQEVFDDFVVPANYSEEFESSCSSCLDLGVPKVVVDVEFYLILEESDVGFVNADVGHNEIFE